MQLLKGKGIATDEQLAPYFEQAKNASGEDGMPHGSGWNATKTVEPAMEKGPAEPAQKKLEKAGNGAEYKKEGDRANKTTEDIASSTEKNGGENDGRKKAKSGEQQGKRQPRRQRLLLYWTTILLSYCAGCVPGIWAAVVPLG